MNNLSARVRILLLVILSALPILGLTVYNGFQQRKAAEIAEHDHLPLIASLTARRPEQIIDGGRQLLLAMNADLDHLIRDAAHCSNYVRKMVAQSHGLYRVIGLVRPDGDVFCNSGEIRDRVNVKDRDYFQMAVSGRKFAVGGYQVGRITGLPAINLAQPMFDPSGKVVAVAFAALNLGVFEEQAELRLRFPQDGLGRVVTISDRNGVVLAQFPKLRGKVGEKIPNPEVLKKLTEQRSGLFSAVDLDGNERLYSFDSVGSNPDGEPQIRVHIATMTSAIYRAANQTLQQTLFMVLGMSMVLFGLAWFGAEVFVTRRFRVLLSMTARVRAGDFSARSGFSEGGEELSRLGVAFDDMASELQRRDTLLHDALDRLRSQAVTDELTGLYNRRHLWSTLEAELVRARRKHLPMALMLFDIDHFKNLNDKWGHEAGDMVLRSIAQTVRRVVRGTDIVARHGGEEFVVVMPDTDVAFAYAVAERLRKSVETNPFVISRAPGKLNITISIGIAGSEGNTDSAEALLHRADQALYRAKREGRNRVIADAA